MDGKTLLIAPGILAARFPKLAVIGLLVLLVASFLSIPRLNFDNNLERSFSTSSEHSKTYARVMRRLGARFEDVTFLIEGRRPFGTKDYATMREFALELQLDPAVASVLSPFAMRFAKNHPHFPGEPVFPAQLDDKKLSARLSKARSGGVRVRDLISEDRKSAIIVAAVRLRRDGGLQATLNRFSGLSRQFTTPNIRYSMGGKATAQTDLLRAIKVDLIVLNLAGSLIAALLALIIFRNFRYAVLALLPAVLAANVSLSAYVWLGYPVTVISNTLPILVLIIGLADSVHLTLYFLQERQASELPSRLKATIRAVGPACALTSITTAIAFLAIAVSDNPQLFEFAITGATMVLLAYVTVMLSFVVILRITLRGHKPLADFSTRLTVPQSVFTMVFRHGNKTIVAAIILAMLAGLGYSQSKA